MVLLLVLGGASLSAQAPRYLRGKVYHQQTGRVLPGVSVKVSGGHSTVTDREGYFALDLSIGDKSAAGTGLVIYLMSAELGNDAAEVTVPSDLSRDIRLVFRSDRYQVVSGTIKDQSSQRVLKGILVQVRPEVQGLNVDLPRPMLTDELGNFFFTLDRERYGNVSHVRITAHDLQGEHYKDWVGLEQMRTGIEIEMEQVKPKNMDTGTICVKNESGKVISINIVPIEGGAINTVGFRLNSEAGPGESPCFEGLLANPAKTYQITIHKEGGDRWSGKSYVIYLHPGTTQTVTIR